ncbi:hypothetical protein Tco_1236709 [Tanacetum coccineum]
MKAILSSSLILGYLSCGLRSCFDDVACLTTSEISDYSLEEFADELALIESFPPGNDDMTPEDVIREIEYLLNHDPLYSPNNALLYTIPEMFTDEHTLDYSSHPRYDDADDDLFDLKTDNDEWGKIFYDDPFDSKENKIKVSKLLVDELDSTGSSSFLPHFLESDSDYPGIRNASRRLCFVYRSLEASPSSASYGNRTY